MDKTKFKRNEDGLFDHIEYKFNEDGYVNWRAMVPKEFIVINKDRFKNKTPEEIAELDVDDLEEKDLLILLGGIKYIARLRGFKDCKIKAKHVSDYKVLCECHIIWRENFETEGATISFSGVGDASLDNTKGFGQKFLGPIAENRAFVRCVRNFLNINIVGNDEIVDGYSLDNLSGPQVKDLAPSMSPTGLLEKALKEKGSSFAALKKALEDNHELKDDEKDWQSIKDIPDRRAIELVSRIKNSKKRGRPRKV